MWQWHTDDLVWSIISYHHYRKKSANMASNVKISNLRHLYIHAMYLVLQGSTPSSSTGSKHLTFKILVKHSNSTIIRISSISQFPFNGITHKRCFPLTINMDWRDETENFRLDPGILKCLYRHHYWLLCLLWYMLQLMLTTQQLQS